MSQILENNDTSFVDRRAALPQGTAAVERRQFTNSHEELSQDGKELALAVDAYKLLHRRRFVNYEEILSVVKQLGYKKSS